LPSNCWVAGVIFRSVPFRCITGPDSHFERYRLSKSAH
jgi:hypothetical protein